MTLLQITEVIVDEENEPLVMADGKILCHVINENGERDTISIEPDIVNSIMNVESPGPVLEEKKDDREDWSEDQTRYILDKYYEYLPQVGPMKKLKLKKDMWIQISKDINEKYDVSKTGSQVENRYKTVLKRKKKAVDNNTTSGAKRAKVDFEDELKKISSIDDSIEPEVLQDQNKIIRKETPNVPAEKGKNKENILKCMKAINEEKKNQRETHHREKEENKERRHKEKMELLKELLRNP